MIGTVLQGKYRVLELLGEGGMGIVYKALDEELDRPVALKLLKGEFSSNPQIVKRFHDETRVLAGFNHPNITTIYSRFDWNGQPVMVMELLDGETFSAMIARRGPIPAEICIPWLLQALAGVGEAHKHGIVHRDLKPANLLLTRSGVVKVMDFGIAKIEQALGMTRTSALMGTPYYMSPEQIEPTRFGLQRVDSRTDIYSMGVTLYELLAGTVPFQGPSEFAIHRAHLEEMPQPPTIYYPHIPSRVVASVFKAMAKDPSQRYQHAEEFARDLDLSASVAPLDPAQPANSQPVIADQLQDTLLASTLPQATKPETPSLPPHVVPSPHPTAQRIATIPPVIAPDPSAPNGLDGLLQKWFGYTGKPRLVGALLAVLILALLSGAGFALYTGLGSSREEQASNHPIFGGGGGGTSGAMVHNEPANSGGGHEQEPLPVPATPPAKPAQRVSVPELLPTSKQPSSSSVPAPVPALPPGSAHQDPVHEPTPHFAERQYVAGRWSGGYKHCENGQEVHARLSLTEAPGSDATKLFVSGQLQVSAPGSAQSCSVRGTFSKANNRLTLWTSCGGSSSADFLAAPHASVLSINQNQMNGAIVPDDRCMIIQFDRE